jgi:hypothetical protein
LVVARRNSGEDLAKTPWPAPPGNPVPTSGFSVLANRWKTGGRVARAGLVAWLIAIVLSMTTGVLFGVVKGSHAGYKRPVEIIIAILIVVILGLLVTGGYLFYRADKARPETSNRPPLKRDARIKLGASLAMVAVALPLAVVAVIATYYNRPVPAWARWVIFCLFWGMILVWISRLLLRMKGKRNSRHNKAAK